MAWDTVPAPNYAAFDIAPCRKRALKSRRQLPAGAARPTAHAGERSPQPARPDAARPAEGLCRRRTDESGRNAERCHRSMKTLAEKGDINAIARSSAADSGSARIAAERNAPDPSWGGSSSGVSPALAGGGEGGTAKGAYSLSQMIQMAENAGFSGDDAAHIAAIAMAESGGDPNATGRAGEVGLTQINPHAWGFAEFRARSAAGVRRRLSGLSETGLGRVVDRPDLEEFHARQFHGAILPRRGGRSWRRRRQRERIASLGASDASAYASPDNRPFPPVSAAAGSPSRDEVGSTAAGAVGGASRHGRPAATRAQTDPAWAGINAALPVGSARMPAAAAAARPAQAPTAPAQGSVASIVAGAVGDPQRAALVARNIGELMGVDPSAPLTPSKPIG